MIAAHIARRFNDDGQRWRDDAGASLDSVVRALPHRARRYGEDTVFEFTDGSAIAFCGDGWDLVARQADGTWRSIEADGSVNVQGWVIGKEESAAATEYLSDPGGTARRAARAAFRASLVAMSEEGMLDALCAVYEALYPDGPGSEWSSDTALAVADALRGNGLAVPA